MRTVDLIELKRDGRPVPPAALADFVRGVARGEVPPYQAAAFLMAVYFRGMSTEELVAYTEAMLHSGMVLDLSRLPAYKVDKHSTGGVGDKVSLALAPMVSACGPCIPMISGRGLGHTGGTLDKLEAIPGLDVQLEADRFMACVESVGFAISGQTAEIAPADGVLYALRDVTATVPSIPLIAASILSKKLAEGLDGLVLDVKVGSGAFMRTREDAVALSRTMLELGTAMGCDTRVLVTDMEQPLGRAVGNANEVAEAIATLRGEGPADFTELCLALGAEMLQLAGAAPDEAAARAQLVRAVESGEALERFRRFVTAQGGDGRVVDAPDALLPRAPHRETIRAARDGIVAGFACAEVGRACGVLGGGRATAGEPIDHAVGLEVLVRIGDQVRAGDPLFEVDYRDAKRLAEARSILERAIVLADAQVAARPLVHERLAAPRAPR